MEALPKTPKELLAAIWAIIAGAAGLQSVDSIVHRDWLSAIPALAIFLALCGIAAMLIFSERLRPWATRISPNWIVGACATLLIIIALSPFVEERRWPFSAWFAPKLSEADIAIAKKQQSDEDQAQIAKLTTQLNTVTNDLSTARQAIAASPLASLPKINSRNRTTEQIAEERLVWRNLQFGPR